MPVKDREELAKKLFGVTLVTLEATPGRGLTFLRAAGTNLAIFGGLRRRGYNLKIHREGWALLQATASVPIVGGTDSDVAADVAEAVAAVDDMDGDWISVIAASWKHRYPEQAAYVLKDLKPAQGIEAVLNMVQVTAGLNGLEVSPDRASTRDEDAKALALLAERGIGPAQRAEAAALLELATSTPSGQPRSPEELAAADEAYVRALGNLRVWYEEWAELARVEIKRRDRLIQLGLAQRKMPGEPDEPEVDAGETPAPGGATA